MDRQNLIALLHRLRNEPEETEWLEFKSDHYESQKLGEYLSALANSACLHGKPRGYLIFGIDNRTHDIVGTSFNSLNQKGKGNQDLLLWLSLGLQPRTGFDCHPFVVEGKHVVLIEVSPAFEQPVKFYGIAYIRIGSSKTELVKYPAKERAIWQRRTDWSAQICERASLNDLDPVAIQKAKREYKVKFPAKAFEVDTWDDLTFLNKTGLAVQGTITFGAILLLGKSETSGLLSPAVARITWLLKDERNQERDYEHFDTPFILNVDRILSRIRNLKIRQLPSGTLFPVEIQQYDPWVLREALHNCIAHQDYGLSGRINLVEMADRLILTNMGSFLPGNVEDVIRRDAPLEVYRNRALAQAMVNLNMIDTQGGGIKRMFRTQMKRFFPLPDYNLADSERVVVTVCGSIINEQYSRMLMERTDLDIWAVMLMDKVQKGIQIERDGHQRLKKLGLVEGRYPNIYISARIAAAVDQKAEHIRTRGLGRQYYKDMITQLVRQHGPVSREEINRLLFDKLPEASSSEQKEDMIHNLMSNLRGKGVIRNAGTRRFSQWVIAEPTGNIKQ